MFEKPFLIKGQSAHDVRGSVSFINEFTFEKVKRFYIVANKKMDMFRGWHGHKKEIKYVIAISGSANVYAVKIDDFKKPSKNAKVFSFKLNSDEPAILIIPSGFANGFKSLTKDAKLMFFSNFNLEESKKDDFRFEEDYWNVEN